MPMRARARRDEAAHLRLDHGQRHLADQRRLARHVRAADDQDLLGGRIQAHVVGDEGCRRPPAARRPGGARPPDRSRRRRRPRAGSSRCGGPPRRAPPARRPPRRAPPSASSRSAAAATVARSAVKISSSSATRRSSAERICLLELAQLGRHEALGVGDRLLAPVVGGHRREVRARDLDVVAEHAVELHLQRRDAGALALARLDGGDAARGRPPAMSRSSSSSGETPGVDEAAVLGDARARRGAARARARPRSSARRDRLAPSAEQVSRPRRPSRRARRVRRPRARRPARAAAASERPSTARSRGVATPRRARADQALDVGDVAQDACGRRRAPRGAPPAARPRRGGGGSRRRPPTETAASAAAAGRPSRVRRLVEHFDERARRAGDRAATPSARGGGAPARR